jgi:Zn-dependent M28 family amino/carboxypeptidase
MGHVRTLGGRIGERNVFRPEGLDAAARYIREVWSAQGFDVREEAFEVRGQRCANLVVDVAGTDPGRELVVVGAHYDSVLGSPGANDNATGVAVLLELSGALRHASPARALRLVAFVNEEPPFFQSEQMGSRRHARQARLRGEPIVAMISLETLGAYSDVPGSQRYPFPLGAFYPWTGNFLGVVGNLSSRALVREIVTHFKAVTDFPVEAAATFAWIPGVDWSDHWAFWQAGYPAVMLTDTALYRYAEYHSAADRPAVVNAPEFARAAHGIIETVRRLVRAP